MGVNSKLSTEVIAVEYFLNSVDTGNNETEPEFYSYKSNENEQDACDTHAHMFHLIKKILNMDY